MQQDRVQDQYPWTWEIPLAVVCAVLIGGVAILQLARSIANWFAGAGWHWPTPDSLVSSIPALVGGDASDGLPHVEHVASPGALWVWLTVVGLLMMIGFTVAGVSAWRRWGPGRMRGMATVAEAHELLGRDRLWRVRHVVRPDLYPAARKVK